MGIIYRTSPSLAFSLYVLFLLTIPIASFSTIDALKPKVASIQFYMHDNVSGPNPTAIRVAPAEPVNMSNPDFIAASFGGVVVMDNLLTSTPELDSSLIGRAQGIYVLASKQDELSFLMTLTYMMVSGPYNGSTFVVVGRNPVMQQGEREMPIVGGTGRFRMARGYCLAQTYSASGMDAVVGYNVTLIHY